MAEFFETGRIADLILLIMGLEIAAMLLFRRATGRGPSPAAILSLTGAGAGLVLALRAALTNMAWPWIAAALGMAFLAHIVDIVLRYRA